MLSREQQMDWVIHGKFLNSVKKLKMANSASLSGYTVVAKQDPRNNGIFNLLMSLLY